MDMATSTTAWGEVRLAKRFGHTLPDNSFIDSDGVPTLNAESAHAALSMGGYKGFGLGLLIEVLGGSLAGMNMGKGDPNEAYYSRDRERPNLGNQSRNDCGHLTVQKRE